MKRKYIAPTIEAIEISPSGIIANSPGKYLDKDDNINDVEDFEFLGRDNDSEASSDIWNSSWLFSPRPTPSP